MAKARHNGRQVKKALQRVLTDYDAAKSKAVADVLVQTVERGQEIAPKKTGRFAASIHLTTGDSPAMDLGGRGERWNLGRSHSKMRENVQSARGILAQFMGKKSISVKIFSGVYYGLWVERGKTNRDGNKSKAHNVFRRMQSFLNSRLKKLGQEIRR